MKEEKELVEILENFNKDEEILYSKQYFFIKGFCVGKNLIQTNKALALARILHDGQYRKGGSPYIIHPLEVCSTLISLGIDDDNLLAASLLHDVVEDLPNKFPKGGIELVSIYDFPEEIFEIVTLLSKKSGLNDYELSVYFNNIKYNPKALLIKLADRANNTESIYIFSTEKLIKYLKETRKWIFDLCSYGKTHYPQHSNSITILKSKISSLCDVTDILVNKYEKNEEIKK